MRIALFTDTYSDDVNGVARTLAMLVGHATARGHEVALVTPEVSQGPAPDAALHIRLPGIPAPLYPDLRLALGMWAGARRRMDAFRPHVAHIATEATVGLSGRRWVVGRGVPLVTSFHTNFPMYLHEYHLGPLEPLLWRYLRWFHGRATMTFCPSTDTMEVLRRRGFHDRLGIWSRGVDTDLFGPHRRSDEVRRRIAPGAERILVYVGRLAAEKSVDVLLDALPRIRQATGPRTHMVFVGDGPARPRLRRRAGNGVHFTGFLTGVALAEAYAAADLFVFASETETFGNVVLEALASGVPAVVVDRGGVRETVVPGRTGVRVAPGSADAFADACIGLLNDPARRATLADGARTEACARNWVQILDEVLDVYEEASRVPRAATS